MNLLSSSNSICIYLFLLIRCSVITFLALSMIPRSSPSSHLILSTATLCFYNSLFRHTLIASNYRSILSSNNSIYLSNLSFNVRMIVLQLILASLTALSHFSARLVISASLFRERSRSAMKSKRLRVSWPGWSRRHC